MFAPPHPKATFGECYMTPAEAAWLVEDINNQRHINAGREPEYYYPAGFPLPVADGAEGSTLAPPITDSQFHVSDPRQTVAAEQFLAEQKAAMAIFKAQDLADERGDATPIVAAAKIAEPAAVSDNPHDRMAAAMRDAFNRSVDTTISAGGSPL